MTEKLKNLMDTAADLDFDAVDLAAVMDSGDRVVRRRRIGLVGGVAALAVVVGGIALAAGGSDEAADRAPYTGAPANEVTWAVGTRILTSGSSIEVGHVVHSFVRTGTGFVVADDAGEVWSVARGTVTSIGRVDPRTARLAADVETSVVGWREPDGAGARWVAYDQAAGRRVLSRAIDQPSDDADVVAVDQRSLYVHNRGWDVLDVDGNDVWKVGPPAPGGELMAVEDDVMVWSTGEAYVVERAGDGAVEIGDPAGTTAVLSPDGRRVSFDADELRVHNVATGDEERIDVDGRSFAAGFEWLGNDTLAVIASRDGSMAELLACTVSSGRCREVVADVGTFDELTEGSFALPVGEPVED
ncbi:MULTISPECIES: hypothetical protein [unclassified Nocardioides]|uniref:hypothetical protein n=1 Tax=unclassified Nocardioides TaxID=2615069 RepID=UPI0007025486|nr:MULTISPECIES: hypothetical protein [unclassified Nocardioides]KRC48762.1 hypothetical protein ASE19_17695 [Nocardioides sp. Root79]KRC75161.1 hypothetical protein ASE20_19595 [Nocardioides sp. Root240]